MPDAFRIRIWVILGDPGAGKSTAIGHLTSQFGATENGLRQGPSPDESSVLLRGGGYLTILSRRMAWQEAEKKPQEVVDLILGKARQRQAEVPAISISWFNVLMALRYDAHDQRPNDFPAGYDYLSHFVRQGWFIESLVLLNPNAARYHYHRFGASTYDLYDTTHPDNQIAWTVGQIRNHFGWA